MVHSKEEDMNKSRNYVDGFVVPVPRRNIGTYKKMATFMGKLFLNYGALDYVECVAQDVKKGKVTSFPQSVKLKSGEVVFFSWISYKSKSDRDKIWKKVMKDPKLAQVMDPKKMP